MGMVVHIGFTILLVRDLPLGNHPTNQRLGTGTALQVVFTLYYSNLRPCRRKMGKPTPKKSQHRLTKEEEIVFVNNGFTATLQHAVTKRGWDKKDIKDFILTYNHNNKCKIPVPKLTKGM